MFDRVLAKLKPKMHPKFQIPPDNLAGHLTRRIQLIARIAMQYIDKPDKYA